MESGMKTNVAQYKNIREYRIFCLECMIQVHSVSDLLRLLSLVGSRIPAAATLEAVRIRQKSKKILLMAGKVHSM